MKKHFVLSGLIVLAAIGIFGYRLHSAKTAKQFRPFEEVSGELKVRESFFQRFLAEPFQERLNESLASLIVFANPELDCPGYLFEAEFWLQPTAHFPVDIYQVLLFVPDTVEPEVLAEFCNLYGIPDDQTIIYAANDSPLRGYAASGVLKIFHRLPEGLVWHEFGNDQVPRQEDFLARLSEEIEQSLNAQ